MPRDRVSLSALAAGELGGERCSTAVDADTAVAPACASGHNGRKDSPRDAFKLGDVMGRG